MTTERFNPGVVIDGKHVEVPGYLWVLGFACAGIAWAIEEASKPETQALIERFFAQQRMGQRAEYIARLEKELAAAKELQQKDAAL